MRDVADHRPPPWACSQWGQYEHDWLDCLDCLDAYELSLEEPMPEPKFRRGQYVFLSVPADPAATRGTVYEALADEVEPHYHVLRSDGVLRRYAESALSDAEAAFTGGGPGKYRTLAAFAAKLLPGEPWFALRAKDNLALEALDKYKWALHALADFDGMASINAMKLAFVNWRAANADKVKNPD